MTLDEAIKRCEVVASDYSDAKKIHARNHRFEKSLKCEMSAEEHRQLAEWLKELKTHREIHDVLLQALVDFGLDICCDDLVMDEEEELICMDNCNNQTKGCWVRWAKMKAKEKCKDADSN